MHSLLIVFWRNSTIYKRLDMNLWTTLVHWHRGKEMQTHRHTFLCAGISDFCHSTSLGKPLNKKGGTGTSPNTNDELKYRLSAIHPPRARRNVWKMQDRRTWINKYMNVNKYIHCLNDYAIDRSIDRYKMGLQPLSILNSAPHIYVIWLTGRSALWRTSSTFDCLYCLLTIVIYTATLMASI